MPKPWIIVAVFLAAISCVWIFAHGRLQVTAEDLDVIRERTEVIFRTLRDHKPLPAFDKSDDLRLSPVNWTITGVGASGSRAHALVAVESSSEDGSSVRDVWELRFSRSGDGEWICTASVNVRTDFNDKAWME